LIDHARTVGTEGQIKDAQELYKIWADQIYEIGIVGLTPMIQGVVVVNNKMKNVPAQLGNDWPLRTPGNARPEQFYYTR
jgi:peptide/nickel transport system substrate-binding protein